MHERFPRLADPGHFLYQILEKYYSELLDPIEPANTKDIILGQLFIALISISGSLREIRSAVMDCFSALGLPMVTLTPSNTPILWELEVKVRYQVYA